MAEMDSGWHAQIKTTIAVTSEEVHAMAKAGALDLRLKRIHQLETTPYSDAVRDELRLSLRDSSNRVVAKAAEIIGKLDLAEFIAELRDLWPRFLERPLESDKGCVAKTAIVDALNRLNEDQPDLFLVGIRYQQFEPVWGGSEDTAINLRGSCAFALARSHLIGLHGKLIALTDLLADSQRLAREHAVNALVDVGHDSVIPLLRLKADCGDPDAEVMGACFSGLLRLARRDSISFVSRFLRHPNDAIICEAAAALGECNDVDAVNALIVALERTANRGLQEALVTSIGLSRQPKAIEFLIDQITSLTDSSEIALRALAPSRFYSDIRDRVQQAVTATRNRRLQAIFEDEFNE